MLSTCEDTEVIYKPRDGVRSRKHLQWIYITDLFKSNLHVYLSFLSARCPCRPIIGKPYQKASSIGVDLVQHHARSGLPSCAPWLISRRSGKQASAPDNDCQEVLILGEVENSLWVRPRWLIVSLGNRVFVGLHESLVTLA